MSWHLEPPKREGGREGPGFWCVTRHEDIHTVSVDPATFSSWLGGLAGADNGGEILEETRLNLMAMDPPEHTALRKAIREPFGPKGVALLAESIEQIAVDGEPMTDDHVAMMWYLCLGARLGRLSVATTRRELLTRLPDIAVTSEARGAHSTFRNWVKVLPVSFIPV